MKITGQDYADFVPPDDVSDAERDRLDWEACDLADKARKERGLDADNDQADGQPGRSAA